MSASAKMLERYVFWKSYSVQLQAFNSTVQATRFLICTRRLPRIPSLMQRGVISQAARISYAERYHPAAGVILTVDLSTHAQIHQSQRDA